MSSVVICRSFFSRGRERERAREVRLYVQLGLVNVKAGLCRVVYAQLHATRRLDDTRGIRKRRKELPSAEYCYS